MSSPSEPKPQRSRGETHGEGGRGRWRVGDGRGGRDLAGGGLWQLDVTSGSRAGSDGQIPPPPEPPRGVEDESPVVGALEAGRRLGRQRRHRRGDREGEGAEDHELGRRLRRRGRSRRAEEGRREAHGDERRGPREPARAAIARGEGRRGRGRARRRRGRRLRRRAQGDGVGVGVASGVGRVQGQVQGPNQHAPNARSRGRRPEQSRRRGGHRSRCRRRGQPLTSRAQGKTWWERGWRWWGVGGAWGGAAGARQAAGERRQRPVAARARVAGARADNGHILILTITMCIL